MTPQWSWFLPGALAIVVLYLQLRLHRTQENLKKREELFQIVTENAADMIALVDVKGRRLYNSPAYKRILGYSAAELGETSSFEQIHPDDRFKVLEAAREARSTGVGRKLDYRIRHKDGSWRVLESIASAIRDAKGEVSKLVIVNRDVTERKRAEEQLEHNSFHDALTGLPNRRLFLDRLQHLFARTRRNQQCQCAVLIADLDGFKEVNDRMGASTADQVIIETGERLANCLRNQDTVARPQEGLALNTSVLSRIGGDEFTILLEGVNDPSDALRIGKRILSVISEPFLIAGHEVRCAASVGIALGTSAHQRAEEVLQDADVALRRAKAMGGARCEVFDAAMHTRAVNRLKLEAELREALAKRQFRVFYQPIQRLETKRITGFEALLRWQHPEQGLISPFKFIQAAEDTGLLLSTGQWMLLEACKQISSWQTEISAMEPVSVCVNVSIKQLADPRFISGLETTLRHTGIDPAQLCLEITENVAAADPKLTATVLSQLKQLRVGVVLDDFASGNISLSGLRQWPLDGIKIGRALVGEILLDRGVREIVELIFLLSRKLKLKVVAAGIESAKQLDHLRALGCEFGQGDLFSPPVDAKAAARLLLGEDLTSHKAAGQ